LGAAPPNPHILALRARFSTRSAIRHLTESDNARSAKKIFSQSIHKSFYARYDEKVPPPALYVPPPRRRESADDEWQFSFFFSKKVFGVVKKKLRKIFGDKIFFRKTCTFLVSNVGRRLMANFVFFQKKILWSPNF